MHLKSPGWGESDGSQVGASECLLEVRACPGMDWANVCAVSQVSVCVCWVGLG